MGHPDGKSGIPPALREKIALIQIKNNTSEANISLKTKEGASETRLKQPQSEPQLSVEMPTLEAEFGLCNKLRPLARASVGECGRFDIAREREIQRIGRNYENRGNEAKECLKTKDITFFNAANFAPFARNLTAIRPQKDQTTPDFAKTSRSLRLQRDALILTRSRLDNLGTRVGADLIHCQVAGPYPRIDAPASSRRIRPGEQ